MGRPPKSQEAPPGGDGTSFLEHCTGSKRLQGKTTRRIRQNRRRRRPAPVASPSPATVSAMSAAGIEQMVAQGRFDRQLALVREHWASVRRLWLNDSDLSPGAKIRSELPPDFWIGCGMPGFAGIKPTDEGRFEFAEDGLATVIVPAYDTIPGNLDASAARHIEHLVDLVAVEVDHPDRFWRRRCEALVLGNAYLEIAGQEGEPVSVFKTPLSWLCSGGDGIVVLDWDWAREVLTGLDLVAEDLALGERLEAVAKPDIWVMGSMTPSSFENGIDT